jgi:hypothetical protein
LLLGLKEATSPELAERAGAVVHKVEMLQLADEKYPIAAERLKM